MVECDLELLILLRLCLLSAGITGMSHRAHFMGSWAGTQQPVQAKRTLYQLGPDFLNAGKSWPFALYLVGLCPHHQWPSLSQPQFSHL